MRKLGPSWHSFLSVFLLTLQTSILFGGTTAAEVERFDKLRREAGSGDPNAQNQLGLCYTEGAGTMPDFAKAFSWYIKAAEKGHPDALNNIGLCYA